MVSTKANRAKFIASLEAYMKYGLAINTIMTITDFLCQQKIRFPRCRS